MNTLKSKIGWIAAAKDSSSATIQTFLVRVLILLVNIVTGTLTARMLGADGRGEQAALILWPSFLGYMMTLGLPSSVIFNFNRHPQKKSELLGAAILGSVILGSLACVIGIVALPHWLSQYSSVVLLQARCLMLLAPFTVISVVVTAGLESESNFTLANQTRYIPPILTLVSLALLGVFGLFTPLTSALSYALPPIPIAFLTYRYIVRCLSPSLKNFLVSTRYLLSYGIRSYGIDILSTLALQLDQVLVVSLLSPAEMGTYAITLSASKMLNVFQHSIVTVLFPKTAARPTEEVIDITGRAARLSTAMASVISSLVLLFGEHILVLLYGGEFREAALLLKILTIRTIIEGGIEILAQPFMALNKPGVITILQGAGLMASALPMLYLIDQLGLLGVGISLLCSSFVKLIGIRIFYKYSLKSKFPSLVVSIEDLNFAFRIMKRKIA